MGCITYVSYMALLIYAWHNVKVHFLRKNVCCLAGTHNAFFIFILDFKSDAFQIERNKLLCNTPNVAPDDYASLE